MIMGRMSGDLCLCDFCLGGDHSGDHPYVHLGTGKNPPNISPLLIHSWHT